MKGYKGYIYITLSLCLCALLAPSCTDEQIGGNDYEETGRPVTVSLQVQLPEMSIRSRALTEDQENQVNDLWIAIYDANGNLTYSGDQNISMHQDTHNPHWLKEIKTKSGPSYIVGVANYLHNYGVSDLIRTNGTGTAAGDERPLSELLKAADTFEKFKSIAVAIDPTQVDYAEAQLPMSGVFVEGTRDTHPADWVAQGMTPVNIPNRNSVTLNNGYLHLRRLVSKVKFEVRAPRDPKEGEKGSLSVHLTGWRLVNNPRISYLHEQAENAADVVKYLLTEDEPNANYNASLLNTEIEKVTTQGGDPYPTRYTFSYYQFENKHTGILEGTATYAEREREYKTENPDQENKVQNTGVYRSLCPTDESPNLRSGVNTNNFASYIELTADVSYKVTTAAHGTIQRTGKATYVIHLGAIGYTADGSTSPDILNDFNVHRNSSYTYTVTIRGIDDVVVEAKDESTSAGEQRPGVEGDVTDANAKILDVDAHYITFNIELTDEERKNFRYEIVAPFGNEVHTFKVEDGKFPDSDPQKNKFYNWIRILPTTGKDVLAAYDAGKAWYLDDIRDTGKTHTSTGGTWYTVFLNEYVYDDDDWKKYVNLPDRTVLFYIVDYKVSADEESKYSIGKYYIRQKSIQTYYNTESDENTTALGVEHINESYGKKLQWSWARTADGTNTLSNANGRWNVWVYLTGDNDKNNAEISETQWDAPKREWKDIIRYCNASGNDSNRKTNYVRPDPTYPVPLQRYETSTSSYTFSGKIWSSRSQDPNNDFNKGSAYFEIVASCMNRNRDLNGDGKITGDELRWYLPAEGKYERIMLGRNSLVTPMFSTSAGEGYWCNPNDNNIPTGNYGYTNSIGTGNDNQVQYVSSDGFKFFPEEGGSFHKNLAVWWDEYSGQPMRVPWNIRCVRNLSKDKPGNVNKDPKVEPVARAYSYDSKTRTFDMGKYDSKSIRPKISTFMMVHTLKELGNNRIARKFQVSEKAVSADASKSSVKELLDENKPCGNYHEEGDGGAVWRAPNQRELMMMINHKVEGEVILSYENGENQYYSCTQEAYGKGTRFYIADKSNEGMGRMSDPSGGTFYVRCVRDIE